MAEQIAKFRFLGYKITDSQIHIDADKEVSKGCDVTFEKTAGVNMDAHKMRLLLVLIRAISSKFSTSLGSAPYLSLISSTTF